MDISNNARDVFFFKLNVKSGGKEINELWSRHHDSPVSRHIFSTVCISVCTTATRSSNKKKVLSKDDYFIYNINSSFICWHKKLVDISKSTGTIVVPSQIRHRRSCLSTTDATWISGLLLNCFGLSSVTAVIKLY